MLAHLKSKYLSLFSNCIPVKGVRRAVIYDLQRNAYDFIPLDLYEILTTFAHIPFESIYENYGSDNEHALDEYFSFLLEKEYIFLPASDREIESLSPLNLTFKTFHKVQNAVIETDLVTPQFDIARLISDLEVLNCKDLELRITRYQSIESVINLLNLFSGTSIQNLVLILEQDGRFKELLEEIALRVVRMSLVIFTRSGNNEIINRYNDRLFDVIFSTDDLLQTNRCGNIHFSYFRVNIDLFKETLSHNNCLFGKIAIDQYGNLKNCPSLPQFYGNINNRSLPLLYAEQFDTHLGKITKSEIKTCQNCEFRMMCTDCRAFLQDPDDPYSKPLKCGYDPQTTKWEPWATNTINAKAILHYKLEELIPAI